jgi:predicted outer membrane repeat protein
MKKLFYFFIFVFSISITYADIHYVTVTGDDTKDGLSWANAQKNLQAALDAVSPGDQIWVAKGTYKPTSDYGLGGDRFKHFEMKREVAIYGGFFGNETDISQRANYGYGETNEAILSGDLDGNDNYTTIPPTNMDNNSYHVLYNPEGLELTSSSILDGFTIKGGNGDFELDVHFTHGAGILNYYNSPKLINCRFVYNVALGGGSGMANARSNPILENCTFEDNYSQTGAIHNYSYSSPVFTGCYIKNNKSNIYAGGMNNFDNSSPILTNCFFIYNLAITPSDPIYYSAGGMHNLNQSNPILSNCTFQNNHGYYGGGVYNNSCSPTITNCSFQNNKSESGGGIYNLNSSATITNCIFLNNEVTGIGGGICNYEFNLPWGSPPINITITNCTFAGNSAAFYGGGILNSVAGGTTTINNSIIWGNTALDGKQISISGGTTRINFSCYSNETGDVSSTGSLIISNCINTYPRFAYSGSYPYSVVGNSPCVNTGNNSYNVNETDIRGKKRIKGGTIDMGAYEWTTGTDPDGLIIYVKWDASGANNGTSWTDAFISFQSALDVAISGDQIWVARGTYKPSSYYGLRTWPDPDPRLKHFRMINGIAIYGGFEGTEAPDYDLNLRDYTTNETILSGDITTGKFEKPVYCYHVFYHPNGLGLTSTAILDGFTITGGKAEGDVPFNSGGGILNLGNFPTELYNPTIKNCTFRDNSALEYGGAISNWSGTNAIITNCTFKNNSALYGGGICNAHFCYPLITNCLFIDNSAVDYGGGIYSSVNGYPSNETIVNCTFTGNSAKSGGGFYGDNSISIINNSILWGNTASVAGNQIYNNGGNITLNYSCYANGTNDVGGTISANNCINTDPQFVGTGENPYSILYGSPCINKGNNAYIPTGIITDLIGNDRIIGSNVDMGAYEYKYKINDGLVAYYPFNGDANDETGNGNDGTVYGATLTEDRFGCSNKAFSFDGVNDYIEVSSTKGFPTGSNARTISLWFKWSEIKWPSPGIEILGYGTNSESHRLGIWIGWLHNLGIETCMYDRVFSWEGDTKWHNLAVTYPEGETSSDKFKLYFDGVLQSGIFNTGNGVRTLNTDSSPLTIGVLPQANVYYFNGLIDEVRIYNRALSNNEIQLLYNEGSGCPEPPFKNNLALWLDASEPKKFEVPPVEAESFFDIWYDMAPLPAAEDASITEEPNRMPRWLQDGINGKPAVLFETDYSATGYGNSDILASPNDAGVHDEITTGETNRWNPDSREKSYILLFQTGSSVDAEGSPNPSYYSDGRQCVFEAGGPLSGMNTYISEGKICIGAWNRFEQKYSILDPGGNFYGANTGIVYYVRYSYDPMTRRIGGSTGAYKPAHPDETSLSTISIENFSGLTRDNTNSVTLNDKTGIGGACRTRYHDYSTGETYSDHFNGMIGEILLYNQIVTDAEILPYIDAKFGTNFATTPPSHKSSDWILIDQTESLEELMLSSAYPNPFSDWTSFGLNLPESQNIRADLFDVYGNKVMSVYSGNLSKGIHNFNIDGKDLPSGMYIFRVIGDNLLVEGKVILMK